MKKKLTILALMISVVGVGQSDSITLRPIGRSHISIDSLPVYAPKYDTIPIIYLYADTADFKSFGEMYLQPFAYWDFGYEVIEGWHVWKISNDGCRNPMFKHVGYLDRQKQPMRKSIVIFMTKTIEKWQPR